MLCSFCSRWLVPSRSIISPSNPTLWKGTNISMRSSPLLQSRQDPRRSFTSNTTPPTTSSPQTALALPRPSPTTRSFPTSFALASHLRPRQSLLSTFHAAIRPTMQASSLLSPLQTQTRALSTTAALGAPRLTYFPTHRVRKRRHGFLAKIRSRTGRMTLKRRRQKGRTNMSH